MSQLEELKKIIVGDNAEDVAKLKQRIENINTRTRDVAEVLPTAIEKRIEQDEKLAKALQQPISKSIKSSIQREPKEYADILYPIMSPAIRMSITSAIRSMLATINQTVESATSIRGWRWRMESMKTGVPYAEIALRHALLYRVEQVFLIDKESGLLISSVVNEDVVEKDSDAVSAMFTAIQSFVQDSFSGNQEDQLTDMAVGEHRVWVVHGPTAMLACVIRGMAPASLRTQLIEILENIHVDYSQALSEFNGDSSEFIGIDNYLEPCLSIKLKDYAGEKKRPPLASILGAFILLGLFAYWLFSSMQQRSQLEYVSQTLSKTPGVLATDVFWEKGKLQVFGLRDPIAELPISRFEQLGISENKIDFQLKPYRSLESEIVIARYLAQHSVPASVNLSLVDQVLSFSGTADLNWLDNLPLQTNDVIQQFNLSELSPTEKSVVSHVKQNIDLPDGVKLITRGKTIVVSGNADANWVSKLNELFSGNIWVNSIRLADSTTMYQMIDEIAKQAFVFIDKTDMQPQSTVSLKGTAEKVKNVMAIANNLGLLLKIDVVGFTDDVGTEDYNQQLRIDRAQAVAQKLIDYGIPKSLIEAQINPQLQAETKERSARIYITATGS